MSPKNRGIFQLMKKETQPAIAREDWNSARPTRTSFYSARNTRAGIEASMAGDCEGVNPTATLLDLSNAGWYKRFR